MTWLFRRLFAAQIAELDALRQRATEKLPHTRVAAIEMELAELRQLHEQLLESHKKLRSRIGMREAREKLNGGGGGDSIEDQRRALEIKHGLRKA